MILQPSMISAPALPSVFSNGKVRRSMQRKESLHSLVNLPMVRQSSMVKVILYRWAGHKVVERDPTLRLLADIRSKELAGVPLEVEVKPWLSHLWEVLRVGGWHPPVLVIDGRKYSQGTMPMRAALAQRLRIRLVARGWLSRLC